MPSRLTGLFRTLTWRDFRGRVPSNPGTMKAKAATGFSPSSPQTVSYSEGGTTLWRLQDNITINVTFDSATSWVLSSVRSEPISEQNRLLKHEQGHYDLTALLARDFFIDLMQLKQGGFSSSADLAQEVRDLFSTYRGKAQPLQDKYDSPSETDHGKIQTKQTEWNGFINRAFTTPRTPAMTAPDGASYKVKILDVLSNAGIRI